MKIFPYLLFLIFAFTISSIYANDKAETTHQDSLEYIRKLYEKKQFDETDLKDNPLDNEYYEYDQSKDIEGEYHLESENKESDFDLSMALYVLALPFYLPIKLLEEDFPELYFYQDYPYAESNFFFSNDGKNWMGAIEISAHYINEDLSGFLINSSYNYFRLSLEPVLSYYNDQNELNKDIYSFQFVSALSFARNNFSDFRFGLGYQHLSETEKKDALKIIYKMRFFRKPFNLNLGYGLSMYDLGIDNKVKLQNEFDLDIGIFIKRFELKTGYQIDKLLSTELIGPKFSLSVWF